MDQEIIKADVQPMYERFARIDAADSLLRETALPMSSIAAAAGKHPNSVSRIMAGHKGRYENVHQIFSAINILTGNLYDRSKYVLCYDQQKEEYYKDNNLERCRVVPKMKEFMSAASINASKLAQMANVEEFMVKLMQDGRPVSENIARAVVNALPMADEKRNAAIIK